MNTEAVRIIRALGGTGAVARIFRVSPPAVSQWRRKGIPPARMLYIEKVHPEVMKHDRAA